MHKGCGPPHVNNENSLEFLVKDRLIFSVIVFDFRKKSLKHFLALKRYIRSAIPK